MHTKLGDHLRIHNNINNDAINFFDLDRVKQEANPEEEIDNEPIRTAEGLNFPSSSALTSTANEDLARMPDTSSSDEDEV